MKRADVKFETGRAQVVYDDTRQSPQTLAAAIDKLGFRATVTAVTESPAEGTVPGR